MDDERALIQGIAELVWSSMLGAELRQVERAPEAGLEAASVAIGGGRSCRITLRVATPALDRAAAALLGLAPGEATAEDREDVLKELANMVGGNLKALLPQPTHLSLPRLGEPPPGAPEAFSVHFDDAGDPVIVVVTHLAPPS
jgi:chemotaxis protein CheX